MSNPKPSEESLSCTAALSLFSRVPPPPHSWHAPLGDSGWKNAVVRLRRAARRNSGGSWTRRSPTLKTSAVNFTSTRLTAEDSPRKSVAFSETFIGLVSSVRVFAETFWKRKDWKSHTNHLFYCQGWTLATGVSWETFFPHVHKIHSNRSLQLLTINVGPVAAQYNVASEACLTTCWSLASTMTPGDLKSEHRRSLKVTLSFWSVWIFLRKKGKRTMIMFNGVFTSNGRCFQQTRAVYGRDSLFAKVTDETFDLFFTLCLVKPQFCFEPSSWCGSSLCGRKARVDNVLWKCLGNTGGGVFRNKSRPTWWRNKQVINRVPVATVSDGVRLSLIHRMYSRF